MKKYLAEFIGTFALVFIGGGAAVFAHPWVGYVGISLSFGFAICALTAAFQDVSGACFNPAIAIAACVSDTDKSVPFYKKILRMTGYAAVETLGACGAAHLLKYLYFSKAGYARTDLFAANMVTKYPVSTGLVLEAVLTLCIACAYLGTMKKQKSRTQTPLAVGLMTAACYMVALPVTKAGLNPARSTAMALFDMENALPQLWIFWLAPCLAGLVAGLVFRGEKD